MYDESGYPSVVEKEVLEVILDIHIKKMDSVYKTEMFKKEIVNIILSHNNPQRKHAELFKKLSSNQEYLNGIIGTLLQYKDKIPFKMEDGSFRAGNVFTVPKEQNVFNGHIINSHIIAQEALPLAKLLQIKDIELVDYEELDIAQQLTADDIEDLQSDYIRYGSRILSNCISHKFISDDLIEKYGLNLYERINYSGLFFESDFPSEPVKNVFSLRSMIKQKAISVRKIIKVEDVRIVHKVKLLTGKEVLVNSREIRENTMQRYRPDSNSDACFCQICRDIKGSSYIETNNIFLDPEYYWPQTRVALCLDYSKKFILIRSKSEVMDRFYKNILSADVNSINAISIPIEDEDIRFTQTHLAELQEIIKSGKK
ncbi:MAG: hypothetical protein UHM85_01695 [Acutalibacteraceae bacterium]|nr:hypothetical protein [Acutalibacteraceae bacterium]